MLITSTFDDEKLLQKHFKKPFNGVYFVNKRKNPTIDSGFATEFDNFVTNSSFHFEIL